MNSINPFIARISKLALALALALAAGTAAQAKTTVVFEGSTLPMATASAPGGKLAVSTRDPGLRALLRAIGASLTWNAGDRYVLFTTAEPQIVSFAVGDARYDVGPRSARAGFAPYEQNGAVYLPFDELMSALYLSPKRDGEALVLQPQLASFDLRADGGGSTLVARAALPIRPRVVSQSASQLVYAFDGLGTTLDRTRAIRGAGVRGITFVQSGTVRDPVTTVTIALAPGVAHGAPRSDDGRDFSLAIGGGAGPAPAPVAAAQETPEPQPTDEPATAAPSGAVVTGVDAHGGPGGYSVDIAVNGDATYEWHRLRDPDNRFWVDVHGASLSAPVRDTTGTDPVGAVRVRQLDAATVRVALSLVGPKRLDVVPNGGGLHIAVYADEAGDDVARSGSGSIGNGAQAIAAAATPAPGESAAPGWKFGAHPAAYVATNPRLIVIDPGHGGSDQGAGRGSYREAVLALDMAKRLRDVLVARGWQVLMTRTTDVDVYKPDDSAHDELQARDDVANNAGARMLISIHVNSFINSGPRGTTTYFSKAIDVPLAQAVQNLVGSQLGTKDDGIVKSKLYVTLHANMPAILVETAFLSNPDDLAKLASPDWRQKMAATIADGVKAYAGAPPPAGQSADQ